MHRHAPLSGVRRSSPPWGRTRCSRFALPLHSRPTRIEPSVPFRRLVEARSTCGGREEQFGHYTHRASTPSCRLRGWDASRACGQFAPFGDSPRTCSALDVMAGAYFLLFGMGSVAGMGTFASFVGWSAGWRVATGARAQAALLRRCSVIAVAVNGYWIFSDSWFIPRTGLLGRSNAAHTRPEGTRYDITGTPLSPPTSRGRPSRVS
jgi:hypothetical protein